MSPWLLVACGDRRAPACDQRVAAMRAAFAPIDAQQHLRRRISAHEAVPAAGGTAPPPDVVVTLRRSALVFEGQEELGEVDRDALGDGVRRLKERLGSRPVASIGLAIDAQAPWSAAVVVLDAAEQTGAAIYLLTDPAAPAAPADAAFARRLADTPSEQQQSFISATVEQLAGGCPAVLAAFARVAIHDEVPAALAACGCAADVEGLTDVIRVVTAPPPTVAVAIDPGSAGAVVVIRGAGASWKDGASEVLAAAPRVAVAVAEPELPPPEPPEPPDPAPKWTGAAAR